MHPLFYHTCPLKIMENKNGYLVKGFKIFQTTNDWNPETNLIYHNYQHDTPQRRA